MLSKLKKNPGYENQLFLNEFLGNTANFTRNEDSLFSTSVGLNTFLNIWTSDVKDSSKINLHFDENTTVEVKHVIDKLAEYLSKNVHNFFASYEGAFFSGSYKSPNTDEYLFPANFFRFLNGTEVTDHNDVSKLDFLHLIQAVKGFVDEENYNNLLKDTYWTFPVPLDYVPFNLDIFPYWSSPSMTLSVNYLALAKYRSLIK